MSKIKITLLSDTRSNFSTPGSSGVAVLNSYDAEEILFVEKWNEPTTAKISFFCGLSDAKSWLLPGNNPGNGSYSYFPRARWVAFQNARREYQYLLVSNSVITQLGNNLAKIELNASDVREWLETHPTDFDAPKKEKGKARSWFLKKLTDDVSNASSFSPVPIKPLTTSGVPTGSATHGAISPTIADDGVVEDFILQNPLSPQLQGIYDFLSEWDYELFPYNINSLEDTTAPFFQWALRKHVNNRGKWLFSEYSQTLKLDSITADNKFTESLVYDSTQTKWNALAGDSMSFSSHQLAKPNLRRQWMGLHFETASVDSEVIPASEDSPTVKQEKLDDIKNMMIKKSKWANRQLSRLTFAGEVIFDGSTIENPLPGMEISIRVLDEIYTITCWEVVSHYQKDYGWSRKSPIEYRGDSFDYIPGQWDEIDGEPPAVVTSPDDYTLWIKSLTNGTGNHTMPAEKVYHTEFYHHEAGVVDRLRMIFNTAPANFWVDLALVEPKLNLTAGSIKKRLGTFAVSGSGTKEFAIPETYIDEGFFIISWKAVGVTGNLSVEASTDKPLGFFQDLAEDPSAGILSNPPKNYATASTVDAKIPDDISPTEMVTPQAVIWLRLVKDSQP